MSYSWTPAARSLVAKVCHLWPYKSMEPTESGVVTGYEAVGGDSSRRRGLVPAEREARARRHRDRAADAHRHPGDAR